MPGPYYTMYLKFVSLKKGANDHELDAEIVYTAPRPDVLDTLVLTYKAAGAQQWTAWETWPAPAGGFSANAKTFPNPPPDSYDVRLAGLWADDTQKVLDTVTCVKPEVTAVQYVTGESYRKAIGDFRVLVRAAATNVGTGSYRMKLFIWDFLTPTWEDKGSSDVIGPDETLVYTWVVSAGLSNVRLGKMLVKVQLIESPGGAVFSETPDQELEPFKDPEIKPPPNRQGTNNMSNASISVQDSLAEFHYHFKERESFYVPVGGGWMPGGDIWLQIMYWDDNIGDWQLLFEHLNPPMGMYAAVRGLDQFLNFADYMIKAKLIGLTTVQDTKVITPNYDPDTGNGTVETLDHETM